MKFSFELENIVPITIINFLNDPKQIISPLHISISSSLKSGSKLSLLLPSNSNVLQL